MSNTSKILSRFIYKQIGKKYGLNSNSSNETDCLRSLEEYLAFYDISIPAEFSGYTRENYGEKYSKDNAEATEVFSSMLSSLLVKSEDRNAIGDILVFSDGNKLDAIGIDCGNGNIFTVSEANGSIIEKKSTFKLLESYKCQQLSQ